MKGSGTFPKFLEKIRQYDAGEIGDFIKGNNSSSGMMQSYLHHYGKLMPAVYILDYTQRKYVYASSNMRLFVDHPISKFLDGGLDFGWNIFQKDDLKVYGENVLQENLKFLKNTPIRNHSDFLFTCNYRVRNKKGEYRQIRQQSTFLKSTEDGMPLATIGFLYDISAYTNKTKIIHTIEPLSHDKKLKSTLVLNNTYFPNEADSLLSQREVEVLKWICEGSPSKVIADKLNISLYTINSHRRSILEKTGSKNLVDLIRYGISRNYF